MRETYILKRSMIGSTIGSLSVALNRTSLLYTSKHRPASQSQKLKVNTVEGFFHLLPNLEVTKAECFRCRLIRRS